MPKEMDRAKQGNEASKGKLNPARSEDLNKKKPRTTGTTGQPPPEIKEVADELPKIGPEIGKPKGIVQKAKTLKEKTFVVYRDDDTDVFKPTSGEAIATMSQHPVSKSLNKKEQVLLDSVAADMERSISLEKIITEPPRQAIPEAMRIEIDRMPSWLGAMIRSRFDIIKSYFQNDTLKFLKNVNIKIDKEYRPEFAYFQGVIGSAALLSNDQDETDDARSIKEITGREPGDEESFEERIQRSDPKLVFLLSEAIGTWKRTDEHAKQWHPRLVHAVAKKLRHDLTLKPSPTDLALVQHDVIRQKDSESEDSDFDDFGKPKWEVIKRREMHQRDAEFTVEMDFTRLPKRSEIPEYVDESAIKKYRKAVSTRLKILKRKQKPRGIGRVAMRRQLFTRGHFRRHSRLLTRNCGEKSVRPNRLEFHYRSDDNFHYYVTSVVGSIWFKSFIMLVITLNALALSIEPMESMRDYPLLWRVLDEAFLALYLMEAALKIYAHPLTYWTSGFNIFDFCILVASILKMINDWLDMAYIGFFRVLLIVRALRILRGISLSVQLQILVSALAQTIRTHVLSVVLLLFLLLYIASIVAYYLFADTNETLAQSWGFIPMGMLRMIIFVTMDGWTEILEEFEQADLRFFGRVFNLIGIVLGNFMFSNIFIAIIIMNISEATDLYRERMRREKREIVRRKKDNVFRRQKLDMRHLLARQKKNFSTDFYHLGEQFQKLLRHDDMVKTRDVGTSPLWIDVFYKCMTRAHHTSVVMMNLHRQMVDNLMSLYRNYSTRKMKVQSIRRGRYNRYMRIKAKLTLLKKEIINLRHDQPKENLRIRIPND